MTVQVVLIGLPGAGKSTTGRRLAKLLAVAFADTDDLIEQRAGRTVREIFGQDGEAEFRRIEADVISSALRDFDGVLALGGGALTTASTRESLAASGIPVVLLAAPVATLVARVGDGSSRPLLAEDPPARLAELAAEREPEYRRAATFTVQTEFRTPSQVAAHVAARVHSRVVRP